MQHILPPDFSFFEQPNCKSSEQRVALKLNCSGLSFEKRDRQTGIVFHLSYYNFLFLPTNVWCLFKFVPSESSIISYNKLRGNLKSHVCTYHHEQIFGPEMTFVSSTWLPNPDMRAQFSAYWPAPSCDQTWGTSFDSRSQIRVIWNISDRCKQCQICTISPLAKNSKTWESTRRMGLEQETEAYIKHCNRHNRISTKLNCNLYQSLQLAR